MEHTSETREFNLSPSIVDSLNIVADRESTTRLQRIGAYVHIVGAILLRPFDNYDLGLALLYARKVNSFDVDSRSTQKVSRIEKGYKRNLRTEVSVYLSIVGGAAVFLFCKAVTDILNDPNIFSSKVGWIASGLLIVSGVLLVDRGFVFHKTLSK